MTLYTPLRPVRHIQQIKQHTAALLIVKSNDSKNVTNPEATDLFTHRAGILTNNSSDRLGNVLLLTRLHEQLLSCVDEKQRGQSAQMSSCWMSN